MNIAAAVDRWSDSLLREKEAKDDRDDAIDAKVAERIDEAMACAADLDHLLERHGIYFEDKSVHITGPMTPLGRVRSLTVTLAMFELLDMIRDGAPIERMRVHETAIRETLRALLRDDLGMQADAEEQLTADAAEIERERRE